LSKTPVEDVFPYFFKTMNYLGCCKHRAPSKKTPLTELKVAFSSLNESDMDF